MVSGDSLLSHLNGFDPQRTKLPAQFRATGHTGSEQLSSVLPRLEMAPAKAPAQQGATGLESAHQCHGHRLLHGHAGHTLGTGSTGPSFQSGCPLACRPTPPWRPGSLPH